MSKKDFIALADAIRGHEIKGETPFSYTQLATLVEFCRSRNSDFKLRRWLDYLAGRCGPNGGAR